ncbi:Tetrahydromethanopterin S-methyltransferase subunit G [Candidatus Methanoperedenaceae archaeon GB50]|nr:Tetrahydromethanopterin S-methyltransferase subunit G [Candidatus Methanoperedenaceae archaeon GB37]CAD7769445.1 Tetrahydromethanopterin S-methyltransferase subunit G [Candidatus Methanoperedenaceae archaeon GB50]
MGMYEDMMHRLDRVEEQVEFASAEIFQQRGIMIGRWIGVLYGIVVALLIILVLGL